MLLPPPSLLLPPIPAGAPLPQRAACMLPRHHHAPAAATAPLAAPPAAAPARATARVPPAGRAAQQPCPPGPRRWRGWQALTRSLRCPSRPPLQRQRQARAPARYAPELLAQPLAALAAAAGSPVPLPPLAWPAAQTPPCLLALLLPPPPPAEEQPQTARTRPSLPPLLLRSQSPVHLAAAAAPPPAAAALQAQLTPQPPAALPLD